MANHLVILLAAFVLAFHGGSVLASGTNMGLTGISSSDKGREPCGGIAGIPCKGENEYCRMKKGTCRIADNIGHCRRKPEVCTDHIDYVCGCDGKTYGNPCEAAMAGMSIDHKGRCRHDPVKHEGSREHNHESHHHDP